MESCKADIRIRIATTTAVMARLSRVLKSSIGFPTKQSLLRYMVLATMLYGWEAWTLVTNIEKWIQAFRWNSRGSCCLSYLEHSPNEYVRGKVESLIGPWEPLLVIVKRWNLTWFGHVTRHCSICKLSSREGTIDCVRSLRWWRQRKSWADNTIVWTQMTMADILAKAV